MEQRSRGDLSRLDLVIAFTPSLLSGQRYVTSSTDRIAPRKPPKHLRALRSTGRSHSGRRRRLGTASRRVSLLGRTAFLPLGKGVLFVLSPTSIPLLGRERGTNSPRSNGAGRDRGEAGETFARVMPSMSGTKCEGRLEDALSSRLLARAGRGRGSGAGGRGLGTAAHTGEARGCGRLGTVRGGGWEGGAGDPETLMRGRGGDGVVRHPAGVHNYQAGSRIRSPDSEWASRISKIGSVVISCS